ncbi:MAG: helix-turn-helix domain-containing protein [Enterococcus lemanii]|jgi:HPt (histidine-containing phosphotransfer) domain-containing protein
MMDTKENFWLNVNRYMHLNAIDAKLLAERVDSSSTVVKKLMHRKANFGIESVYKYAKALEIQPIDLFEEWTDEEWEQVLDEKVEKK